jgi:transcriptional regulator with XRE-family HTH domain
MRKTRGRKKKDESRNDWGARLFAVMKEKHLSVRDVARIAGVSSPSVIDSWMNSATPGDLMAVNQLCKKLNVSFRWLLTGEHDEVERTPVIAEIFEEVPYFDGLARIRIDRLIERKKK